MDVAELQLKADSKQVDRSSRSLDAFNRRAKKTETATERMNREFERNARVIQMMRRAMVSLFGVMGVREIIQYKDQWQNTENQLRQVTNSTRDLTRAQQDLLNLSRQTRSDFSATSTLYARLIQSTKEMNIGHERLLRITGSINKALAVYGATAQESEGAIRQLAQGLAAGALRGDEFNSVAEQAPAIMDAIAAHLKMTRGELREFAAQGGITSQIVIESMEAAADTIDQQFSKSVATFGQNMTIARTNVLEFIGTNEQLEAMVSGFGEFIVDITNQIGPLYEEAQRAHETFADGSGAALEDWYNKTAFFVEAVDDGFAALFSNLDSAGLNTFELLALGFGNTASSVQTMIAVTTVEIAAMLDKVQASANEFRRKDAQFTYKVLSGLGMRNSAWAQSQRELFEELSAGGLSYEEQLRAIEGAARDTIQEELSAHNERLAKLHESVAASNRTRIAFEQYNGAIHEGAIMLRGVSGETREANDATQIFSYTLEGAIDALKGTEFRMEGVTDAVRENWEYFKRDTGAVDDFADSVDGLTDRLGIQANMVENLQREWANLFNTLGRGSDFGDLFDVVTKIGGRGVSEAISADAIGLITGSGTGALAGLASGAGEFLSGLLGDGVAGAGVVGPPTSAAAAGSGLAGFLTSPAGIAAMAAIAGKLIHDATNDPDGRHRGMAGFLSAPTPGAPAGSTFAVDPFASGFSPTGFADGPVTQEQARVLIDQFRTIDQQIVDAVLALGGRVNAPSSLGGFSIEGTGAGTFFGRSDITTDAQFMAQFNSYFDQLADNIEGIDQELLDAIQSASSFEQGMQLLTNAVAEHTKALEEEQRATESAARALQEATAAKVREYESYIDAGLRSIDSINGALGITSTSQVDRQIQRILNSRQGIIDAYQEEIRAAEDLHRQAIRNYEEQLRLSQQIGRGLVGILTGSDSALSNQERLSIAKQDFFSLSQQALGGDTLAASQLTQSASTVISLAREMYASGGEFKQIFEMVTAQLGSVESALGAAQHPGQLVPPGQAEMIQQLNMIDQQLIGIRQGIVVDSINEFLKMNISLDALPDRIAQGILAATNDAPPPTGNHGLSNAEIAQFARNQFEGMGVVTESDAGFNDAARNIIIGAIRNDVTSQQLVDAWNAANPGANANAADVNALARELGLPEFAQGGIANGPTTGYPVMLHGPEMITPMSDFNNLTKVVAGLQDEMHSATEELRSIKSIHLSGYQYLGEQGKETNLRLVSIDGKTEGDGFPSDRYSPT